MDLETLIRHCPSVRLERPSAAPSTAIVAVTDDSRLVRTGALFVARVGTTRDGVAYVDEAIRRGAAAVLVRAGVAVGDGPALLRADEPARAGAALAEALHGHPSGRLRLVAVTGTNGKTTVAFLVRQLCGSAGVRCGLAGTVLIDDGVTQLPATLTTPPAAELSALLARMVDHGCAAAAIEASSHALDQDRLAGLRVSVGIYTNLSGDHLDYHGSMEAYAGAKARLFAALDADAIAVINADDPHAERMLRDCRARVVRCSLKPGDAPCRAELIDVTATGSLMRLMLHGFESRVMLPLAGAHNAMNALQAAAAAIAVGVEPEQVADALRSVSAPSGRLEPVTRREDPWTVLVDYAHTDDALDNVLRTLRAVTPAGRRLIVVFGCGGDRDRTKRPRMAAVACRHAHRIVITSDNPRTEPPESIIDQILDGVPLERRADVQREADRAKAIAIAVDAAQPGDVVVIAGKGHEVEQVIGQERRPFDDRLVASAAVARRRGAGACAPSGSEASHG